MDFKFSDEDEAFRREFRTWLDEHAEKAPDTDQSTEGARQ